jgi:hypothetical protein
MAEVYRSVGSDVSKSLPDYIFHKTIPFIGNAIRTSNPTQLRFYTKFISTVDVNFQLPIMLCERQVSTAVITVCNYFPYSSNLFFLLRHILIVFGLLICITDLSVFFTGI